MIWESTDCCCKQYRCDKLLLSSNFNIRIDRITGTVGQEKNLVDTINVYDKQYTRAKICMVRTLEVKDSKRIMNTHSMVGVSKSSFEEENDFLKMILDVKVRS